MLAASVVVISLQLSETVNWKRTDKYLGAVNLFVGPRL